MRKHFQNIAKTTLILTYLVIIAGAVVRMTGSGMGCPDWPKCFGYYVPPTEETQLKWKPNYTYKKGQVIILNETLQVAKNNFITSKSFSKNNWKTYTKHNYATFNPLHTWVEYINRLFGALAGFATLLLAFVSLKFWKKHKVVTLLSFLIVLSMGFQAWLGKTVVDSNLAPLKITIHMIMALVIVAMILFLIYKTSLKTHQLQTNKLIKTTVIIASIFTFIQIVLGTQVRQFIDEQTKFLGYENVEDWLRNPNFQFYFHRSFSIVVFLINGFLFIQFKKLRMPINKMNWVILLLILEILSGILMAYFNFPFSTQTIHLVIASILFGVQFYFILEVFNLKKIKQTL